MSLATELLAVLDKFRTFVSEHTNSGQLVTIDDHIDQIANVVTTDVNAADTKAKEVLGALYGALHGAPPVEPTPVEPPAAPVAAPVDVAQVPQPEAAPVADLAEPTV